jgi:DOMON domain
MINLVKICKIVLLLLTLMTAQSTSNEIRWDHSVDLDENFRLLWRVKDPDIIFELQVRTHGYIGFGFTRSEYIYGADMIIGWVDDKHTFFQVSFSSLVQFHSFSSNRFEIPSETVLPRVWVETAI